MEPWLFLWRGWSFFDPASVVNLVLVRLRTPPAESCLAGLLGRPETVDNEFVYGPHLVHKGNYIFALMFSGKLRTPDEAFPAEQELMRGEATLSQQIIVGLNTSGKDLEPREFGVEGIFSDNIIQ